MRLRVSGWVATPLAVTLTAYAEQPWSGPALVLDLDDHALTWAAVAVEFGQARILGVQVLPQPGTGSVEVAAARCRRRALHSPVPPRSSRFRRRRTGAVRPARRSPGGVPPRTGGRTDRAHGPVGAEHPAPARRPGRRLRPPRTPGPGRAARSARCCPWGPPPSFWSPTRREGCPAWCAALEQTIDTSEIRPRRDVEGDDFGEGLIDDDQSERGGVSVLSPDAAARAACDLAARWQRGELESGPVEVAPLPAPLPADAGPARSSSATRTIPCAARRSSSAATPTATWSSTARSIPPFPGGIARSSLSGAPSCCATAAATARWSTSALSSRSACCWPATGFAWARAARSCASWDNRPIN